MKLLRKVFVATLFLSLMGCYTDRDDCCEEDSDIINPFNDPLSTGIPGCPWESSVQGRSIDYPIRVDLPSRYDLAYLMPTPRSQGEQGSCAAWATHFYLGTYLRNVATDSIITAESEIMSPAFSFNQVKVDSSTCSGSFLSSNFEVMLQQGVLDINTFPYDDQDCNTLPDQNEMTLVQPGIISSYESVGPYEINDVVQESREVVKSALLDGRPVVITMKIDLGFGLANRNNDFGVFYVKNIVRESFRGCHAMVIVGFDDDLDAFRVINSWGEGWANNGFIYISYDFFRSSSHPQYQEGVIGLDVAFTD